MSMDKIYPSIIKIKYDCLKIDNIYSACVSILKINTNIKMIDTLNSILCLDEIEVAMYVEKQNTFNLLKKLTNIIGKSSSEYKSISNNQIDINVIENIKQDAIDLRKKIQVENEGVYNVNIYLTVKGNTMQELQQKTTYLINRLYAFNIYSKPCNFKQKEAYIASLPILKNAYELAKHTNIMFTETALGKMFPFYTTDIIHDNGIILGKANGNICALDPFNKNYNNYNMCIFGTSGAGKSYFVKLMIIRELYKQRRQIIIDPEGEYEEITKRFGGIIINKDNYNPFHIAEEFVKSNKNFYQLKIKQVKKDIKNLFKIEDDDKILQIVNKLYKKHGINENCNSLYKKADKEKIYASPKYTNDFPTVMEFIKEYGIKGRKDILCEKTNLESDIYCFSLKNMSSKQITYCLKLFIPKIYELIKDETTIYLDEAWKCLSYKEDSFVLENIYSMIKTLRKKKAGITIISQDVSDLFYIDNMNFGKSVMNNTNVKALFKMDWADIEVLEKMNLKKEAIEQIKMLDKGNAYIMLDNANFVLNIEASGYEHKIIEGKMKNEKTTYSNE